MSFPVARDRECQHQFTRRNKKGRTKGSALLRYCCQLADKGTHANSGYSPESFSDYLRDSLRTPPAELCRGTIEAGLQRRPPRAVETPGYPIDNSISKPVGAQDLSGPDLSARNPAGLNPGESCTGSLPVRAACGRLLIAATASICHSVLFSRPGRLRCAETDDFPCRGASRCRTM